MYLGNLLLIVNVLSEIKLHGVSERNLKIFKVKINSDGTWQKVVPKELRKTKRALSRKYRIGEPREIKKTQYEGYSDGVFCVFNKNKIRQLQKVINESIDLIK